MWAIGAPSVMRATVLSSAVALICAEVAMRRLRPRAADDAPPAYDAGAWRQAALPLVIIGTTEALMNRRRRDRRGVGASVEFGAVARARERPSENGNGGVSRHGARGVTRH
jgi:hypothetical protein